MFSHIMSTSLRHSQKPPQKHPHQEEKGNCEKNFVEREGNCEKNLQESQEEKGNCEKNFVKREEQLREEPSGAPGGGKATASRTSQKEKGKYENHFQESQEKKGNHRDGHPF